MDRRWQQLASGVAVPARYVMGLRTGSNLRAGFLAIFREVARLEPLKCFVTGFSYSFFS